MNPNFTTIKGLTLEEITNSWQCRKRDSSVVRFDTNKIADAIRKCFNNTPEFFSNPHYRVEKERYISEVTHAVVYNLASTKESVHDVEAIQRLVIQQLWGKGIFEAAESYQNYREERRKARRLSISSGHSNLIAEDAKHFPSPLQYFQYLDKYARWSDKLGRRETWRECVSRVMEFFRSRHQLKVIGKEEWYRLEHSLYTQRSSPAMRIVQMAGPSLERCNSGAFNCCYIACDDILTFPETLYLLMQGCGVGFSVESEYVECLPKIKKQRYHPPRNIVIGDSTEGWCDAYKEGIMAWVDGYDVIYDYSQIRPEGSRLFTKGGRASGPGPLKILLDFVRSVFFSRQGSRLTPKDCHNILCMTGKIVQVGGVRRSSEISLSDLDDLEMRTLKTGNWWETSPWLDMANNSAVYEDKPDTITFMEEWLSLAKSGSGERGIFNRYGLMHQVPKRRKKAKFGMNPCGEILLRSKQMCNLSIAVARYDDTVQSLEDKVTVAAIFGTLQSTLTDFKYIRPEWKTNCEEERLLGVDITGQMDCPLLRPSNPDRSALLRHLRSVAIKTNEEYAKRLSINISAAVTAVKPSGNSAAFFACSSGLHTRWSKYQIRRIRVGRNSPMAMLLKSEGVPYAIDPMNDSLLVFDFLPLPAPDGTPTRNDMTAVEQFRNWLDWKVNYTEHNPSATIYVGPDEWLELGTEVYKHFDKIGGLTFLPRDGGNYRLAPNEEITQEEYDKRKSDFPEIDWAKLSLFEMEDMTTPLGEIACSGSSCEM